MFPGGLRRPVRRADKLTTFMYWLSWNPEDSNFWNAHGLSRTLKGLLYLCFKSLYHYMLRGDELGQSVEALGYKPEGRGFDSRWCRNFSVTYSFRSRCGPGVDSASNRNEYREFFLVGKGGRWVRLTILPPSCADCLEIWEPQPPGTLSACPGL